MDTDKHPDVSRTFEVRAIPDARILDADGTEIRRVVGFKNAQRMLAILKQVKSGGK